MQAAADLTEATRAARAWIAHHTRTGRCIVPVLHESPLSQRTPQGALFVALLLERDEHGAATVYEARTRTVLAKETDE